MGFFDSLFGGTKTPTTTTNDLPEWMKPYAQDYLKQTSDFTQTPYQAYGGQLVAGMNPYQQQGIDQQAQLGASGTAAGNAGQQQFLNTIGGQNLNPNSNPYLQSTVDAAQGDLIRNYNMIAKPATESAMANSGSFGNSGLLQMQQAQQSDLERNLGRISTDLRGSAYNTDRGYQQQALGMSPMFNSMEFGNAQMQQNAGQQLQGQQQNELSSAYDQFLRSQQDPYQKLGLMGSALGHNFGTQQQGQSVGASPLGQIGGLAMAATSLFSDERLKEDITKVGKTDDGLNIFTYRYKGGGPVHMGVMAQEVEKKHPEAVTRHSSGYRMVDYGLLGGAHGSA